MTRHRTAFAAVVFALAASGPALAEPPTPQPRGDALSALTTLEAATLAQRRPVSLVEVLRLARQRNPDLTAARATAAQAAAKASLVFSAVLPDVTASASFVHTSAPAVFDQSGQVDLLSALTAYSAMPDPVKAQTLASLADAPALMEIQAANSIFGQIVVQQVLFTPQLFLLPAAGEAEEAAHLGALEAQEQILVAVARLYLGLEGLRGLSEAAREAEAIAQKRERDASTQVQLGTATDIAVLRAQQELSQARSTLATLAGQRVALLAMLEAMVGEAVRPLDGEATRVEATASDEAQVPWEKTYAVRSAAKALDSQGRFNTYDRLSWMPSLVAQAKGSYNSNKGFNDTNWIFDGILALQWQLYDRGVRRVERRENDAKTVEYRAKLEGARAKARASWYSAKSSLAAAQVALDEAEATLRLATRAQHHAEAAFQVGFSTGLEVSEIDSRRFLAASAVAQARTQLQLRAVELLAAEGRLAEAMGVGADEADDAATP